MKKIISCLSFLFTAIMSQAQSPIGKWKKVSHMAEYEGQKFDSHAALLSQRPCAAKIVYEINADGTFRLNAANSGCDESYRKIQERLYSESRWKQEGNKFIMGGKQTGFAAGQQYIIRFSGNKMTWVGTDGQGTIIYEKLQ